MIKTMQKLIGDKRGTSSVEYGFILVMIVLAIMSALSGFATESTDMWDDIATKSDEAINGID